MIVEKLAELAVDELVWLDTVRGVGNVPKPDKVRSWAVSALEQSRGVRLLEVGGRVAAAGPWKRADRLFVADRDGPRAQRVLEPSDGTTVVLIGPEGGFSTGEVPPDATPVSLANGVLRVETAAIAAAVLLTPAR